MAPEKNLKSLPAHVWDYVICVEAELAHYSGGIVSLKRQVMEDESHRRYFTLRRKTKKRHSSNVHKQGYEVFAFCFCYYFI